MPIINREETFFNGRKFHRIIKVNSAGQFSIGLPQEVAEREGKTCAAGMTRGQALAEYDAMLARYTESKTSTRRVILYSVEMTMSIVRGDKCVFDRSDVAFTNSECVIGIAAGNYIETKIITDKGTEYIYKRDENKGNFYRSSIYPVRHDAFGRMNNLDRPHSCAMDWTQEREDFFCRIGLALEQIALELDKLNSPEAVIKMIAAGGFKALPST